MDDRYYLFLVIASMVAFIVVMAGLSIEDALQRRRHRD
jgi:hypothetical protein